MPDKTATIAEYRLHETDTGSPEVQIAILTERIITSPTPPRCTRATTTPVVD